MSPKPAKSPRDLSELRSRLALATPQPVATIAPPPGVLPRPHSTGRTPSDQLHPPAQPQVIGDQGPLVEVPGAKQNLLHLAIAGIAVAVLTAGVGWASGRIFAARALFNDTIEDARTIRAEVVKISKVNQHVVEALARARARSRGRLVYDAELLKELKTILSRAPDATPQGALERQERLFQTNYALMEGIVIEHLFKYYNNALRLADAAQGLIQQAESSKELILRYSSSAGRRRKHGVVIAKDARSHYQGRLVEVGNIVCADRRATNACRRADIRGFYVRSGPNDSWSPRAGRPGPRVKVSEIVIPIIPDQSWRQVASHEPGYSAYNDYVARFGSVAAIAALLAKDGKKLVQELSKAASRKKLVTLF